MKNMENHKYSTEPWPSIRVNRPSSSFRLIVESGGPTTPEERASERRMFEDRKRRHEADVVKWKSNKRKFYIAAPFAVLGATVAAFICALPVMFVLGGAGAQVGMGLGMLFGAKAFLWLEDKYNPFNEPYDYKP
jgi:hypothetical protein